MNTAVREAIAAADARLTRRAERTRAARRAGLITSREEHQLIRDDLTIRDLRAAAARIRGR